VHLNLSGFAIFAHLAIMPVFQETSNDDRNLRLLPSLEQPLPRLSARPRPSQDGIDKFEVVVIGVGQGQLQLCESGEEN